ncbi:MAG: PEGA domain-containing protein [Rhodothermales bacterium]
MLSKRYERHVFLVAVGVMLAGVLGVLFFFTSPVASEEALNDEILATIIAEQKAKSVMDSTSRGLDVGLASALSVTTQPSGAVVLLDQEMLGVTPLENRALPGGTYALTVQITGYATVDTLVMLEGGQATDLSIPLRKGATYALMDSPAENAERDAAVSLLRSDRTSGASATAPERNDDFETQLARATAERSGDATSSADAIRFASDETFEAAQPSEPLEQEPAASTSEQTAPRQVPRNAADLAISTPPAEPAVEPASEPAALPVRTGTLKVLVKPWGSIYINGTLHQRETDVRYATSLPPDVYRVTAVHPTLGTSEHTVRVTAGEEASLEVDFNSPARPAAVSPVSAADDSDIAMPTFENQ